MKLPYYADCASLPMSEREAIQALNAFDDTAREINFDTFARNTDWQPWARHHYGIGSTSKLLHLKDDYHVRYKRGKFLGKTAYVCMWSGYHVIFIEVSYE